MTELRVLARRVGKRDARDGGLPRLADRGDAAGGAVGVRQDAAAREVEQVGRVSTPPRFRGLQAGLAGGDDGEDRLAAAERLETRRDRADDRVVVFPELVGDA